MLQDPGSKGLLKSFQDLFLPHDKQKRLNLKQKAFSCIAARLQKFDWLNYEPTLSEMKTAALLAWEGYLTSVEKMSIVNIDITDIPQDQMEKLISFVKEKVSINKMTPSSQLGSILASVKCRVLELKNMKLSQADTQALVTIMRDRVKLLTLYNGITLDIEELTKYDGRGRCRKLEFEFDVYMWRRHGFRESRFCEEGPEMRSGYGARFRRWAEDVGWMVTGDTIEWLVITRESAFEFIRSFFSCEEAALEVTFF